MAKTALLPIVFLVLAAGCADDAAPQTVPGDVATPPPMPRAPDVAEGDFLWAAGGSDPVSGESYMAVTMGNGLDLKVHEGAALLIAELAWTCASPTCSLHAYLIDPDGNEAGHATGSGSAVAEVAQPAPGVWTVFAMSDGPTAMVQGTMRATASYDDGAADAVAEEPAAAKL